MEFLGSTPDGGRIIKMSAQEFTDFRRLAESVEGHTLDEIIWRGDRDQGRIYPDFGSNGVFGAIEAFYLAQFKVNALRDLLNEFQRTLNDSKASGLP